MYISDVRSSIVWDGCTEQDKNTSELLQNEATRKVTALTRSTSIEKLYKKCGWVSLAKRRHFQKLCFMFKCINYLVKDYISDIIPPRVREISNYPLRNRKNVSNMYTRTENSHKSCIPSSISYWNNLQTDIKEANTYASFHQRLKPIIYDRIKVPIYFVEGNRKLSILHANIRNNWSDLKSDLFRNHLSADSRCSCGNENEDTSHYFFECENFNNLRVIMFHRTRPLHPLSLNMMLYGNPSLSSDEYFLLFQTVHALIKASGRFR